MFKAIAKPFGVLLLWFYNLTGSYGLAVILFALVVKVIFLPFQLKTKKSQMRMTRLTPKLKDLEKRYEGNQKKYQEEMQKLYKQEGVNPMSGCLWTLIPFPILIALYQAIRYPLTIMMGVAEDLLASGGAIAVKLSELGYSLANFPGRNSAAYEQIFQSEFITSHFDAFAGITDKLQTLDYSFLGIPLSNVPDFKFWAFDYSSPAIWLPAVGLFLIPVISAALSYLSMKVSSANSVQTQQQQQSSKSMMLTMPLVSLWICFTMPAVMGIYWIAQSVFSTIQDIFLTKYYNKVLDKEDAVRIEQNKLREAELEQKRLETERLKAEGKTERNLNTSKKKIQAVEKQKEEERKAAELAAAEAARKAALGIKDDKPASQVGSRRFARGRAYVPDRFAGEGAPDGDGYTEDADDTPQPDIEAVESAETAGRAAIAESAESIPAPLAEEPAPEDSEDAALAAAEAAEDAAWAESDGDDADRQ